MPLTDGFAARNGTRLGRTSACLTSDSSHWLCLRDFLRRRLTSQHDREQTGNQQNTRNGDQCTAITPGSLPDIGYKQRSKNAGKTPGGEHQSIDRSNPFRTKIICGKGRHRTEATAIAADYDKADKGKQGERPHCRQKKKEYCLQQEHDQENVPAANRIREPGPE